MKETEEKIKKKKRQERKRNKKKSANATSVLKITQGGRGALMCKEESKGGLYIYIYTYFIATLKRVYI